MEGPIETETAAVDAALGGDASRVGGLFESYRERIGRMVAIRLDGRLRGRVDPSDVVQDAFLEASRRLPEYAARRDMPFFLWVRFLAGQRLAALHRRHLGAEARDARREVPILRDVPGASTVQIVSAILESGASPSNIAARAEDIERLEAGLDDMREIDREVLVMRHFEGLSNAEVASALGLERSAASQRYLRALKRLQETLGRIDRAAGPE